MEKWKRKNPQGLSISPQLGEFQGATLVLSFRSSPSLQYSITPFFTLHGFMRTSSLKKRMSPRMLVRLSSFMNHSKSP